MYINLEHYIGRIIEIIYLDRSNRITQRRVEVRSIDRGMLKAYCIRRRAPRVFQLKNILAAMPLKEGAAG